VAKVMLSAVVSGMLGIYLLRIPGLVRLHRKSGLVGSTVIGGLIFGVGFALLGYCPGTLAGAAGQGSLDALLGGAAGMLLGTGVYSVLYPRLEPRILNIGDFGKLTLPQLLSARTWPGFDLYEKIPPTPLYKGEPPAGLIRLTFPMPKRRVGVHWC
jgi:uncharacterized membrane protein YedE/YeeE